MDIVYSSTTLLNIKRLTVVNGNACYEIEVKDKDKSAKACKHKFVCTLQSTKFIAMIHDGNLHIFSLMQDQDGIFPKDLIRYIDENRNWRQMCKIEDSFLGQPYSKILCALRVYSSKCE